GCHGLRIGAGQLGGHLDGRKIDLGQGRHRQQIEDCRSHQEQRQRQQRCPDGAPDEMRGDTQSAVPDRAGSAGASAIFRPGRSLYWPSTTTRCPADKPLEITDRPSWDTSTETGCTRTVLSAWTTYT